MAPEQTHCPNCRKATQPEDNPSFPFCSERCKLADLGRWLKGNYAIPGDPAAFPEDGSDEGEGP